MSEQAEKPALQPDIQPAPDRGESVTLMEPIVVGDSALERAELTDLTLELA